MKSRTALETENKELFLQNLDLVVEVHDLKQKVNEYRVRLIMIASAYAVLLFVTLVFL